MYWFSMWNAIVELRISARKWFFFLLSSNFIFSTTCRYSAYELFITVVVALANQSRYIKQKAITCLFTKIDFEATYIELDCNCNCNFSSLIHFNSLNFIGFVLRSARGMGQDTQRITTLERHKFRWKSKSNKQMHKARKDKERREMEIDRKME